MVGCFLMQTVRPPNAGEAFSVKVINPMIHSDYGINACGGVCTQCAAPPACRAAGLPRVAQHATAVRRA
jgi:hypothetical protein